MPIIRRLLALSLLTVATVACGGGGDSGTNPTPPNTQGASRSPSPRNAPDRTGASGTLNASVTRGGSFTGPVVLTAETVPAGIAVTFNPATVASGATSSAIAVSAIATVAPGSYTFVVRAQGSGNDARPGHGFRRARRDDEATPRASCARTTRAPWRSR
ncbi:MAG: hypothetical protein IPP20_04525 [Gemmatimonadetes bacterium]|nr:hypothetical protein [Gemmatimonadota bacterium]